MGSASIKSLAFSYFSYFSELLGRIRFLNPHLKSSFLRSIFIILDFSLSYVFTGIPLELENASKRVHADKAIVLSNIESFFISLFILGLFSSFP